MGRLDETEESYRENKTWEQKAGERWEMLLRDKDGWRRELSRGNERQEELC